MTLEKCRGCRDDFYNHNNMGMNMDGGKPRCWSFSGAVMVKKLRIPTDMRPPYRMKPETVPNCYSAKGYSMVTPDALTKEGYWR